MRVVVLALFIPYKSPPRSRRRNWGSGSRVPSHGSHRSYRSQPSLLQFTWGPRFPPETGNSILKGGQAALMEEIQLSDRLRPCELHLPFPSISLKKPNATLAMGWWSLCSGYNLMPKTGRLGSIFYFISQQLCDFNKITSYLWAFISSLVPLLG
jgi:hypothetical protein